MKNNIIKNSKILIVDDQPENLSVTFEYLNKLNAEVMTIQEGAEVVELAETKNPDIILLDIIMPDMNGFEVCKKLKENKKTADIPIIFMSCLTETENIIEGFECGGIDYITKPVQIEELIVRITNHLTIYYGEKELKKYRNHLEELVEKRTSELKETNEKLNLEIIKHKITEEELKLRNILLETQQETSIEGILVINEEGRVISYNQKFIDMWEIPPEIKETKSDKLFLQAIKDKLFNPGDFLKKVNYLYKNLNEKSIDEIVLSDNRIFECYSSPMIGSDGRYYGRVWRSFDITKRKNMEKNMAQTQKMQAIGTLAGGIAHDFNNILMAIMGYTELGLLDLPDNSSNIKPYLKNILISVNRSQELIKQILTFSRKTEFEYHPIRIQPIIKESIKFLKASLPTSIKIVELIDEKAGIIMGDPIQIEQIIINLFTNAYHAMKEGIGKIEITLEEIYLSDNSLKDLDIKEGKYIRLTVRDNGHGMESRVMERIFEPYFTTKDVDKGTGLGLSVVMGIVKGHNGEITVNSKPGKGTTFYIYLPLIEGDPAELRLNSAKPAKTGNERILLVDDEEDLVFILKSILEKSGYTVISTTSSLEALEIIKRDGENFDLVITDRTMPNMTGKHLAIEIKKIYPHIPIIMCTGNDEAYTQNEESYIKAVLLKPIKRNILMETIQDVLNKK